MIYKYVRKDAGLAILDTHKVRFTKASKLNDPFESDYRTLLETSLDAKEEWLKKAVGLDQHLHSKRSEQNDLMNSFALFCASKVPDNILMWSHYADKHKGIVLGFGDAASFLGETYYGRYDEDIKEDHLFGRKEYRKNLLVQYSSVKYVKLFAAPDIEPFRWKSIAWNYEEEFRVIKFLSQPPKDDFVEERFGDNDLIEVCFGARVDKKEIADLRAANERAKTHLQMKYYRMELNAKNYVLDKKEID